MIRVRINCWVCFGRANHRSARRKRMNRGPGVTAATLACLLMALPLCVRANTIHVPRDQPTIQAAIDVAQGGDTILVANGTYTGPGNRDIVFSNKGITLLSEGGSSNCILDLQG